jgi:hypothetical protein
MPSSALESMACRRSRPTHGGDTKQRSFYRKKFRGVVTTTLLCAFEIVEPIIVAVETVFAYFDNPQQSRSTLGDIVNKTPHPLDVFGERLDALR